jgi:hypothetical protein
MSSQRRTFCGVSAVTASDEGVDMRITGKTAGSTSRPTAVVGASLAAVAALALAGCGSSSSGSSAASPSSGAGSSGSSPGTAVKTAWTTTSHADSARMTMDETVRAAGKSESMTGSGVTALKGAGQGANGQFTMVSAGQHVEMRVLGTTLYEKLPPGATSKALSAGKPWISIDTTKIASSADGTANQAPDASAQLGYLGHAQQVTKVGSATVDGVATTHYRMTIAPGALGSTSGVHASKAVPVDVWVDGSHRVRQEKLSMAMTASGASASPNSGAASGTSNSAQSISITITMHLRDFGTPVHVTAPPEAQVTDATAHIASMAKNGGGSAS